MPSLPSKPLDLQGLAVSSNTHQYAEWAPYVHRVAIADYRAAMGIDWMNRDELSEAIPPAYCEHIGSYLMLEVKRRASERAA